MMFGLVGPGDGRADFRCAADLRGSLVPDGSGRLAVPADTPDQSHGADHPAHARAVAGSGTGTCWIVPPWAE